MASVLPFPIRCPISHPTESLLLHDAAAKGRLETTQFLVRQKGQGPNESDRDGNAPLHHAAYNGRLETVAFLAEHSDPDIRGNHSWTPLHFASREGHLEVAKHLVETCRASVSVEENGGRNAVDLAACAGNLGLIRNSGCTALHYAAYEGDLEIIRYLASEWRVSVLSKDNRGNTALHYSAIAGHADAVELFTKEINCDPNVQNAKGDSPLHIACRESHLKVVQVLAEQFHVNRALKNEVGQTPLEIAIAENAQAIIEALQSTKPIADVEPPAKKPRLDEVKLNSSQDQESRPVLSGHEEYSQPPSKTGSPPPTASSTADSHSTDVQNPRHREAAAEGSPEPLDPMEDESDEPSLSLSTSKCILLHNSWVHIQLLFAFKRHISTFIATVDMPPEFHAKLMPFVKKHAKLTGTTLGIGTYGSVEEIDIRGRLYAGKVFKVKEKNKFYKHLCSEICIISNLEHPNIVKYCGVCVIANIPLPVLLMERLENNLHDYILTPPNANIELSVKQLILRDVSCGLEYLHSHEAKVIHRDLTTKNVLLDSNLCAKITDFGNARIINLDTYMFLETMTARPGTIEYMPPEAFEEGCKYTTKLDIFSFGHMALVTAIQENVHPLLSHTYTREMNEVKSRESPGQKRIDAEGLLIDYSRL